MPQRGRRVLVLSLLASLGLGFGLVPFATPAGAADEPASEPAKSAAADDRSLFIDPDDHWIDISEFLATKTGFMPIPIIMTEPTLGYGGGAGLLFIDPREKHGDEGFKRPNITAVGGLVTENGTWVAFAGDVRHWLDGRLKTNAGVIAGRIRLDFYGLGHERLLSGGALEYQLKLAGLRFGGKYRIGNTHFWVGANYQFATVNASFDQSFEIPRRLSRLFRRLDLQNLVSQNTRISGPALSITYDSRKVIFTPRSGIFSETTLGTGWEALAGTSDYQNLDHVTLGYVPVSDSVTLGLRGDLKRSFGSAPFYIKPSIAMRGIPAQRYQGKTVAQGELELRWQFWRRFSLVAFGGGGAAWAKQSRFDRNVSVYAGGVGFRYELARKFGLHYGIDVAYGPDGGTFYFQLGSAWMRP
ncbi:MAG: hypothetical protein AAEJ52_07760 [Myxococcota bacterium]